MMNRTERRMRAKQQRYAQEKAKLPPGKAAAMARLLQNGITPEDLKKEYDAGFQAGFNAAAEPMIKSMYAAVLLAAHEHFGFGKVRGVRLLNAIDRAITDVLTSEELMQEVYDKIGVEMDFTLPVERAREAG